MKLEKILPNYMDTRNTKWNKKVFALYTLNCGLLRSQKSSSTYYIQTNYKKILRGRGLEKTRRGGWGHFVEVGNNSKLLKSVKVA